MPAHPPTPQTCSCHSLPPPATHLPATTPCPPPLPACTCFCLQPFPLTPTTTKTFSFSSLHHHLFLLYTPNLFYTVPYAYLPLPVVLITLIIACLPLTTCYLITPPCLPTEKTSCLPGMEGEGGQEGTGEGRTDWRRRGTGRFGEGGRVFFVPVPSALCLWFVATATGSLFGIIPFCALPPSLYTTGVVSLCPLLYCPQPPPTPTGSSLLLWVLLPFLPLLPSSIPTMPHYLFNPLTFPCHSLLTMIGISTICLPASQFFHHCSSLACRFNTPFPTFPYTHPLSHAG